MDRVCDRQDTDAIKRQAGKDRWVQFAYLFLFFYPRQLPDSPRLIRPDE
jgi:hypothetical protein